MVITMTYEQNLEINKQFGPEIMYEGLRELIATVKSFHMTLNKFNIYLSKSV